MNTTRRVAALYPARLGRPSIAPERLLRVLLLQAFYGIRSERQLMERMEFDLLLRRFVGLGGDDPAWDHSSFSKNRDRLLEGEIAAKFLAAVVAQPKVKRLLSSDHFSVDGTLLEAWASLNSIGAPTAAYLFTRCTPSRGLEPLGHTDTGRAAKLVDQGARVGVHGYRVAMRRRQEFRGDHMVDEPQKRREETGDVQQAYRFIDLRKLVHGPYLHELFDGPDSSRQSDECVCNLNHALPPAAQGQGDFMPGQT